MSRLSSVKVTARSMDLLLTSGSPSHTISRNVTGCFSRHRCHWTTRIQQWRYTAAASSHRSRRYSTTPKKEKISDPLDILFCGSDKFSCDTLEALHEEHVRNPDLIRSIDVVVRPSKPTGRGMKVFKDPSLLSVATGLGLNIHTRDTFTGWDMPSKTNLIIAVSFGLFVPHRLLRAAKYGGLNLHPSLLPDLWGPAPLQHTLLLGRPLTGVTLQTLDHAVFDHGVILAQTPADPEHLGALRVPATSSVLQSSPPTVADLLAIVTPVAAKMLVRGLRDGLHVPPLVDRRLAPPRSTSTTTFSADVEEGKEKGKEVAVVAAPAIAHAHKITKDDRRLSLSLLETCQAEVGGNRLARRHAAIGPLWFMSRDRRGRQKRIIVVEMISAPPFGEEEDPPREVRMVIPGDPRRRQRRPHEQVLADSGPVSPRARQAAEYTAERMAKAARSGKSTDAPRKYFIPFVDVDVEQGEQSQNQNQGQEQEQPQDQQRQWEEEEEEQQQQQQQQQRGKQQFETYGWNLIVRDVNQTNDLQFGNYRLVTLKVEGDKPKPARLALRNFFIGRGDHADLPNRPTEPTEPTEQTEEAEETESTEPTEPTEQIEPNEPTEHSPSPLGGSDTDLPK